MAATRKTNDILIINCDDTFPLDSVQALVEKSSQAAGIETCIKQKSFPLPDLKQVSEEVRRGEPLLCAILVLNAHESRLSINEKNAGIGYAVLYRALLEASKGRTVVVIGGDEESSSADRKIVSNRIRYKVASQFEDEYLDGRKGSVFSWGKNYYPVHMEAFKQYLCAIKKGLELPFAPTSPFKTTGNGTDIDTETQEPSDKDHESVQSNHPDSSHSLKVNDIGLQNATEAKKSMGENKSADPPSLTSDQSQKSPDPDMSQLSNHPASPSCLMGDDKHFQGTDEDKSNEENKPQTLYPRPEDIQAQSGSSTRQKYQPSGSALVYSLTSDLSQTSPDEGMSLQSKQTASAHPMVKEKELQNVDQDKNSTGENESCFLSRRQDGIQGHSGSDERHSKYPPTASSVDSSFTSDQSQTSPDAGILPLPKHSSIPRPTAQTYPGSDERHRKLQRPDEKNQEYAGADERHEKYQGSDDRQRQEIERRLKKRLDELKQRYPGHKAKLFGVLRYGKLDERYIYPLEGTDDTFTVPPYMTKAFREEKRNTPEADVIIFIDLNDGQLTSTYWDVSKSSYRLWDKCRFW